MMKTPCVKICKLVDSKCIGCGRRSEQTTMWSKYKSAKEKIIKKLKKIQTFKDGLFKKISF